MSTRYNPDPLNSFTDMRAVAKQEASALLQSQSSIGLYAPKSIPWQAVDLPLVTVFPASPQDRDEVNLYDEEDGTVSRWVWSRKFNAWLIIGGGPTGTIGTTALDSPPAGAIVADGSAVTDTYPRLKALLVAAGNPHGVSGSDPLRPDLMDKTIVGAGGSYILGASGGAASVALSTGELPSHTHSITSGGSHSHTINQTTGAGAGWGVNTTAIYAPHNGTDNGFDVTTSSAGSHDHGGATGSAGSGTAHENMPPFVALTPFIWT